MKKEKKEKIPKFYKKLQKNAFLPSSKEKKKIFVDEKDLDLNVIIEESKEKEISDIYYVAFSQNRLKIITEILNCYFYNAFSSNQKKASVEITDDPRLDYELPDEILDTEKVIVLYYGTDNLMFLAFDESKSMREYRVLFKKEEKNKELHLVHIENIIRQTLKSFKILGVK